MMYRTILLTLIVLTKLLPGYTQADTKHIREGNKYFEKKQFDNSEISYRKALEEKSNSFNALFNLGDALYKQEKFEDAANEFVDLTQTGDDRIKRARSFHNLGNSLLKANKIQESIEAYKNSLRNDPADRETKYNLAYAQDLLEQQEQQQQQDKKENQDGKEDQEQQKDQQDNKENQEQQEENEQQSQPQDKEKQPSPSQQQQISKEDAQRLLEALENDEKKLLEKIKKSQARKKKVKTLKNW